MGRAAGGPGLKVSITRLLPIVILAAAYFAAAEVGFASFDARRVTLVWPPAGIALAALLIWGGRLWPGIAAGALLANLTITDSELPASFGIMVGNTLEALAGYTLLRRGLGFRPDLKSPRDVAALVVAAGLSSTVAATIGAVSVCTLGGKPWVYFASVWWIWWLGDAMGILLVAPFVLVWTRRPWKLEPRRVWEALLFAALLFLALLVFFLGDSLRGAYPLEYTIFPFVVWAALRFSLRGVTLTILAVACMAIIGTRNGYGPFADGNLVERVSLIQLYLSMLCITGLFLAASSKQRLLAERNVAAAYAITRLISESPDLSRSTSSLARCVCEQLGWDAGALWNLDRDGKLRCSEFWITPGSGLEEFERHSRSVAFDPGVGLPGRVWVSRKPAWIINVVEDGNFPRAPHAASAGIHSGIGFPVLVENEILGVMEFLSREEKESDEEVLRMLTTVGSQIGQLLDRQRNEEEIRRSEALKAAVLDAAQDGIVTLGPDHRIVEFNSAAEAIFGYRREEVLGKDLVEKIAPGHLEADMLRALSPSESSTAAPGERAELVATRAGGELFPVEVSVAPILGASPPMRTATFRDITERKRAEEQRERLLDSERTARSEAEKANRVKDDFLATLSHELRTPLQAILGWSALLKQGGLNEEEETRAVETIERNARVQTQIIEDLLDMSRILSGKTRLEIRDLEAANVIEQAIKTVMPSAESRGISIEKDCEPGIPVRGDATRLQQVVWNLLSNAIKFTPEGGRVGVSAARRGNHAVIEVSDTGQGIAEEFLPHLFERFRQADASTTRLHGGLGLGLAIVKNLIELHGGSIAARSAGTGRGSTFTVTLPLGRTAPARAPAPEKDGRGAHAVDGKAGVNGHLRGVRVLLVDDGDDTRKVVQRMLERCGAEVVSAASGEEALRLIGEREPTVLVSDIAMPHMDGYELIQAIRSTAGSARRMLPAVALSAFGRPEDRARALSAGYQVHVSKPVDADELVRVIAGLTGRHD